MGKINVLSFAVANLIAAGEVVDRPSSVIKELLENAIDSGANRIVVEIQHGGVTYMRVSDNGCGMEPEDLPVAIRRHATSKIKDASDLDGILTLGFRGEALAAIASVSDLRILSKTKGAAFGAMLEASGGEIKSVSERACSDGTTVIVENLFANVPARRKFLKKDVTEAMAVTSVVEKIALSKPHIAFRLMIDGTNRLETVGDGNLKNTIYSVFGREFAAKMISLSFSLNGIEVNGFTGRSDNVRANRNYQNFFINGRYVKSKTACAAIEQAYTSYIPPEKFPCCILFLTVHPSAVDVNVHPAKLEVKFSNEKPVFEAVYYAIRNALESNQSRPDMVWQSMGKRPERIEEKLSDSSLPIEDIKGESVKKRQLSAELHVALPVTESGGKRISSDTGHAESAFSKMTAQEYVRQYHTEAEKISLSSVTREKENPNVPVLNEPKQENGDCGLSVSQESKPKEEVSRQENERFDMPPSVRQDESVSFAREEERQIPSESVPLRYRIVGEVFHAYILVETEDTMLVIDQHAAHERILFEQLKAGMHERNKASQMLMLPLEVMLTSEEIQTLVQFREEIEAVGFSFTAGRYTVNITAIPEGIATDAVSDMLAVMADRIKNNTGSAKLTRDIIFEKALYQAACKAAIKAGREYPEGHIEWLVRKLMEIPDITVCPHGRPVAMEVTKKNLDHQFERT